MSSIRFCLLILTLELRGVAGPLPKNSSPSEEATLHIMKKVADWQLAQWGTSGMKHAAWSWGNAVSYLGFIALADASRDTAYINPLLRIGMSLDWRTGPDVTMADDYCVGQMYSILYRHFGRAGMLYHFRKLADSIAALPHTESLEWKNSIQKREWAWCDALFMGPASLAYLSTATGDLRYLDLADTLWWKTTDYLFDPQNSLYFRDSRYFGQKEPNGRPVFWSRGNGWVLAGLVRVLSNMPADYRDRPRWIRLYRQLAARVASLQQADGSWRTSLLDPDDYPEKETSGTALFCYALAWGINHHLLDHGAYDVVVQKAWKALVEAVQPDGRLGYVQQIGEKPGEVGASSTEAYGVGAFLLAGSEIIKMK